TSAARAVPLASNRFATLAQATRSTRATAPRSTSRAGRTPPKTTAASGSTCAPRPSLASGYRRSRSAGRAALPRWGGPRCRPGGQPAHHENGMAISGRGVARLERQPHLHPHLSASIGVTPPVIGVAENLQSAKVRPLRQHADDGGGLLVDAEDPTHD